MDAVFAASEKVINAGYNKEYNGDMFNIGARELTKVVKRKYNITTDWNAKDNEMLHRLTYDVWQFSAAKNYQQMRDLTLLLKDESGNLKNYEDFKKEAIKVIDKYNDNWFRTEYNLAVASSQNAARWVDFQKDKENIAYLKYQTVGDSAVRYSHQVLDGVIKHIDDVFWDTHYPPNGYGCRCEVIQTLEEEPTPPASTPNIAVPKMFRTNLANSGLIFPKGSAYYVDIPAHILVKSLKHIPVENAFIVDNYKDKKILTHINHTVNEVHHNTIITKTLLDRYSDINKVELLPNIHQKEIELKKKFYPKRWHNLLGAKNPDALIQIKGKDHIIEYKYLIGSGKTIQMQLTDAAKKSEYAVIMLSEHTILEDWWIKKHLNRWFLNNKQKHFKGCLVLDHKGRELYKKSDLL